MSVRTVAAGAVVALLFGLIGCAAPPAPSGPGVGAAERATCTAVAVAPFSCNVYLVTGREASGARDTAYLKYQNAES